MLEMATRSHWATRDIPPTVDLHGRLIFRLLHGFFALHWLLDLLIRFAFRMDGVALVCARQCRFLALTGGFAMAAIHPFTAAEPTSRKIPANPRPLALERRRAS